MIIITSFLLITTGSTFGLWSLFRIVNPKHLDSVEPVSLLNSMDTLVSTYPWMFFSLSVGLITGGLAVSAVSAISSKALIDEPLSFHEKDTSKLFEYFANNYTPLKSHLQYVLTRKTFSLGQSKHYFEKYFDQSFFARLTREQRGFISENSLVKQLFEKIALNVKEQAELPGRYVLGSDEFILAKINCLNNYHALTYEMYMVRARLLSAVIQDPQLTANIEEYSRVILNIPVIEGRSVAPGFSDIPLDIYSIMLSRFKDSINISKADISVHKFVSDDLLFSYGFSELVYHSLFLLSRVSFLILIILFFIFIFENFIKIKFLVPRKGGKT